jgi:fumarate hydratase, class II
VEGTRLNRTHIDEMLGRSLMPVTALSPVIGYDKASPIAHRANDEGLTLKEAALKSGYIGETRSDAIVNPKQMVGMVSPAAEGLAARRWRSAVRSTANPRRDLEIA